jgi:hypothetical protein
MNKKLIMALVATLIVLPLSAKSAEANTTQAPTIAIIDTALDTSLSLFKDRIAYEVCIVEFDVCPNGKPIMEGPGSAVIPADLMQKLKLEHGTQMASLAVKTNMTVKIVFIRIQGIDSRTKLAKPRGNKTVDMALDWIIANQSKFNIQAVSMSQSAYNVTRPTFPFYMTAAGTDYCPKYPATDQKVNQLVSMGVPSFFPTGNNADQSRIAWPACIPSSIAIGAVYDYGSVAEYSNRDNKLVDFYAQGNNMALGPNNQLTGTNGTSGATVIAATSWATIKSIKPGLTYTQIYDLIGSTSKPSNALVAGKVVSIGKTIDLVKATQ